MNSKMNRYNRSDQIIGDAGEDSKFGGDGRDEIIGGTGNDIISGNDSTWLGVYRCISSCLFICQLNMK